jgi:hypothetical protein
MLLAMLISLGVYQSIDEGWKDCKSKRSFVVMGRAFRKRLEEFCAKLKDENLPALPPSSSSSNPSSKSISLSSSKASPSSPLS